MIKKTFMVWMALFAFSAAFSQEAPAPVRGQERRGEAAELRVLAERYHASDSEGERDRIKAELRKLLSERRVPGEAEALSRLERLENQAEMVALAARKADDEILDSRISELLCMIKETLAAHHAEREAAVDARLERMLGQRRERGRPVGR